MSRLSLLVEWKIVFLDAHTGIYPPNFRPMPETQTQYRECYLRLIPARETNPTRVAYSY